jgi:GGDEF domain-containing protein
VAERICESLASDGKEPKLSVSIGIAIYPKDGEKVDSLLSAADAALYAMKVRIRSGPNTNTPTPELNYKAAAGSKIV